jgi:N-acetylglucosaminyldiphosphoundecaprenol N-acetyl-beta-D-mannosaminyltransferase
MSSLAPVVNTPMVLGIRVDPLNMESAIARILFCLREFRKGYVCLIGVHGIAEAQRNRNLARLFANATLMVPDGMPTVWIGQMQGFSQMERVAGPDLMLEVFGCREFSRYRHFLYGGKEGVADELRDVLLNRFPWVEIVGTCTPPFRDLSLEEEQGLASKLDELKVDMVWVGISTPKQERFMSRMMPFLSSTLMFGVGAAFDYHTGRIKDSPRWMKRSGLQWFHRLIQDPRHLFWRYFRSNSLFLWRLLLEVLHLEASKRECGEMATSPTEATTEDDQCPPDQKIGVVDAKSATGTQLSELLCGANEMTGL